jgi:ATP-dependent Zn protease
VEIEELIQSQFEITTQTLIKHKKFLLELAKSLLAESSLTPKQIQAICTKNKIPCEIENENFVVYEKYAELLEKIN